MRLVQGTEMNSVWPAQESLGLIAAGTWTGGQELYHEKPYVSYSGR